MYKSGTLANTLVKRQQSVDDDITYKYKEFAEDGFAKISTDPLPLNWQDGKHRLLCDIHDVVVQLSMHTTR